MALRRLSPPSRVWLALALLLATLVLPALCQFPGGGPKKKKAPANKDDIRYIRCQVCDELSKKLHRDVAAIREERPNKKVSEMDIMKITENVCNPDTGEGEWITRYDLVEEGPRLLMEEQGQFGECHSECRTIARACEEIVGDHDTDIAEELYKGEKKRAGLFNLLCYDLSSSCTKDPPPLPADRTPGPAFKPKDEKAREMEQMMRRMREENPDMPGMNMFSREDLMEEYFGDDDDDEDEALGSGGRRFGGGEEEPEGEVDMGPMEEEEDLEGEEREASTEPIENANRMLGQAFNHAERVAGWVKSGYARAKGKLMAALGKGGGHEEL